MQNYPNPVAGETVFEYSVRTASNIVIHIYDLNGRLVESLQEGNKVPGIYSRLWNRNQSGLEDGTYFYRLQAKQGFSLPRKLVLVQE
ncbi:MAG: T9SS type A sorting domain-containing protein [Saprospiraceae bacterium]|nr:T9SS type A sorting domain-containing protein [Saprospiraceae bacterium]